MGRIRTLLLALLAGLLVLAAVVLVRAAGMRSRQLQVEPAPRLELDQAAAAARLAEAIRYETVSNFDPSQLDPVAFQGLHDWLRAAYPRTDAALGRETVADWTLLYTWPGSDPSLPPLLLLAHQDVVPAAPDTLESWTHPPFEGVIADGYVWGRGAIDDKGNLVAELEAVERLLRDGFAPRRTLMLAFGHDEEVGGRGAEAVAGLLAERGIAPELVVDEGMAVIEGMVPGLARPAAMIGIAEKGYMSLALEVHAPGGHSSTPPPHTAVGILAAALVRLEDAPLPAHFGGVVDSFLAYLAPELPFGYRAVLANRWLFGPLLLAALERNPGTNASIRTTTAITMVQGSPKDNVLPSLARAVVNFRILPGDDPDAVIAHVVEAVDDDRVEVKPLGSKLRGASPVTSPDSPGFGLLQRTIDETFPDAIVAPALVLGGTDSRHYTDVARDVLRFGPWRFGPSDLARPHGIDERVSVEGLADAIRFYVLLIRNATG